LRNLAESWRDGCIKLYLIWKAISFRRDHADLFREGEFIPLRSLGAHARNVAAFIRKKEHSFVLAAFPRWLSQLPAKGSGGFEWGDTMLSLPADAPAEWDSILMRGKLSSKREAEQRHLLATDLFREFPVGLFHAEN